MGKPREQSAGYFPSFIPQPSALEATTAACIAAWQRSRAGTKGARPHVRRMLTAVEAAQAYAPARPAALRTG
jgi:hypothetical protein